MKPVLMLAIPAAFCAACAGGPSDPPPSPAVGAAAPADQVAKLYNDYLNRLPCPDQATCGTGPPLPVTAVRCRTAPAPGEALCIFLVSIWSRAKDQTYRCEGAFGRRDGAWRMTGFTEECLLASERARTKHRFAEVPGRRTIEEIESGFALQEALLTAGPAGSGASAASSRVKVRRVNCWPTEGAALCTYESDRCLAGDRDKDGDGWCGRRARFLMALSNSLTDSRGWTIDRPESER